MEENEAFLNTLQLDKNDFTTGSLSHKFKPSTYIIIAFRIAYIGKYYAVSIEFYHYF